MMNLQFFVAYLLLSTIWPSFYIFCYVRAVYKR